jgi:hypothetical protein
MDNLLLKKIAERFMSFFIFPQQENISFFTARRTFPIIVFLFLLNIRNYT